MKKKKDQWNGNEVIKWKWAVGKAIDFGIKQRMNNGRFYYLLVKGDVEKMREIARRLRTQVRVNAMTVTRLRPDISEEPCSVWVRRP